MAHVVSADAEVVSRRWSLGGWSCELVSALIHLLLLLVLSLICLPSRNPSATLILDIFPQPIADSLEELTFEVAMLSDATIEHDSSTSAATSPDAVWFSEPTLATRIGDDSPQEIDPIWGVPNERLRDVLQNGFDTEKKSHDGYSEFFGVASPGNRFVYVVDVSTSMKEPTSYGQSRLQVAIRELVRSIERLDSEQEFQVILFCYQTYFFPADGESMKLVKATAENKDRLRRWLSRATTGAGTDPRFGVMTALRMHPDAIFLLSDGEFNGQRKNLHRLPGNPPIEQLMAQLPTAVPIHTICFAEVAAQNRLRRLADGTGGKHQFVGR